MKPVKYVLLIIIGTFLSFSLIAQDRDKEIPIDFALQLKNMHLWRGLQITNEAVGTADLSIKDKSDHFRFGIWGGAGINGKFKEFDYYASFQSKGFKIAVWDIYNFSEGATYNNTQVFNYKAHESGHFVDVSVGYTFQGSFPLSVNWSTVVFGRDRGAANEKNLYSSYVSLSYPVLRHHLIDVDLGLAGAFALDGEKGTSAHFYGKHAGIVDASVMVSKKLEFGSYTLPISVIGAWNPANNDANMQVALTVLSF